MKNRIVKSLLPFIFVFVAMQANAEKVVGTCNVDVAGPHPFKITGKLYEGKVPANTYESMASTRAWMLNWAEEMRPHSPQMADDKAKIANEMLFVLTINCRSEKGTLSLMPVGGAKAADYPDGPRMYRLMNDDTRVSKSGDIHAVLLSSEFQTGAIQPAEPGELKITQSDGEKLVATFSFKSKTSTVTGNVNFTRPKEEKK